MATRQDSLRRYYPYLLTGGALLVIAAASYRLYTAQSRSSRRLRRSNATRRRTSPSRRRQRATTAPDPDPGGILTNEQLLETLNQAGEPPLNIPESAAEALRETGHAAQQARGARSGSNGVDGREGRAGRRGSVAVSDFSFTGETKENNDNQNLLTLLYTIAQDQAQRDSYVHRGVTCNNCQIIPIRGIRYRCANCVDYDLCEVCEAVDGAHPKTHLFYKIRIPAPFIGNPRHAQVPCYPGKPQMMMISLTPDAIRQLCEATKFEQAELEALYEQFKVLAASEYNDTKFGINGAISRDTFDKCFIPNTHLHPPTPNLIYDRMFNFYDTKGDNLIDFEEFAVGVAFTNNKAKTPERLRRIFQGYDLNGDGYVERKDFLRMFKAFYSLSKVLVRDIVASLSDDLYEQGHMDQALYGRQPISAIFTSSIPPAGRSWEKSHEDSDEDSESPVVLPSSKDHMDLGDIAKTQGQSPTPEKGSEGAEEKLIEDTRRADFWTLATDDDDLMLPDDERDVGSEVLFHMALCGINELLDMIFKEKEKAAVEARFADVTGKKEPKAEKAAEAETKEINKADAEGVKDPSEAKKDNVEGGITATATATTNNNCNSNSSSSSSSSNNNNSNNNNNNNANTKREEKEKEKASRIAIREEIKQRGGEGRLNYEEFEKIMTGSNYQSLEFVATWTDLASF